MADESWWDSGVDWVGKNWDTISSVAGAAAGAYGVYNKTKAENAYADYLKQNEIDNAAKVNENNAYQEGVGRSEYDAAVANNAIMASNMAAQTEAMRINEINRLKAAKRASKYSKNMYKKILKMYEPYKETADMLLPQKTQAYQNSLAMQNAMGQYVQSPTQMAKLDAPVPAYNVNIPLPDSVRLK